MSLRFPTIANLVWDSIEPRKERRRKRVMRVKELFSQEAPPLLLPPNPYWAIKVCPTDCRRRWGLFLALASVTGMHSGSASTIWCDQFRWLSSLRSSTRPPFGQWGRSTSTSCSHVAIHLLPWHFISSPSFFSPFPLKNILSFAFIPPLLLLLYFFFFPSRTKKNTV